MKYLVFWIISITTTIPCDPPSDPYGGNGVLIQPSIHCSITTRDTFHRFFDGKSDALQFVNGANGRPDIEKIWMDSTIIPESGIKFFVPEGLIIQIDTTITIGN